MTTMRTTATTAAVISATVYTSRNLNKIEIWFDRPVFSGSGDYQDQELECMTPDQTTVTGAVIDELRTIPEVVRIVHHEKMIKISFTDIRARNGYLIPATKLRIIAGLTKFNKVNQIIFRDQWYK